MLTPTRSLFTLLSVCITAAAPGAWAQTTPAPLQGWVDLHAHPMTHLAWGGKLVHGAPDVGSLLPADSRCAHNVRATSMEHALGTDNSTHGGSGFDNGCGDSIRAGVIDQVQIANRALVTPDWARGAPDFAHWPKWNDVTHQKMWFEWVRRARDGGLRVMVGLATHNQTLAAAVSGPGDGPTDDRGSADLQVDEMKAFVGRHRDFMEVALTPADLRRIARANKIAVVLGVEIDSIGNFNKTRTVTNAAVTAELRRLHAKGVRYIFPVHVIDNGFGGTAVYQNLFNISNYREFGSFWDLECSRPGENIGHRFVVEGFDAAVAGVKATKLGIDIFRNPPNPPVCTVGTGHVNRRGMTAQGQFALKEMMRLGMLIDLDHMSRKTVEQALALAEAVPGGYPLSSGHNGMRAPGGSENSRTPAQVRRIAALGGMFGVGSDGIDAPTFVRNYGAVAASMSHRGVGLGTDLNGLVKGPPPRAGSIQYAAAFPKSRTGTREWDYNTDGVAHYGMLADFLRDLRSIPGGAAVERTLMLSAEHFAQSWERCETQKLRVR
jgi:microsomal dipeptidase-like Zn-dependent dipeptidase